MGEPLSTPLADILNQGPTNDDYDAAHTYLYDDTSFTVGQSSPTSSTPTMYDSMIDTNALSRFTEDQQVDTMGCPYVDDSDLLTGEAFTSATIIQPMTGTFLSDEARFGINLGLASYSRSYRPDGCDVNNSMLNEAALVHRRPNMRRRARPPPTRFQGETFSSIQQAHGVGDDINSYVASGMLGAAPIASVSQYPPHDDVLINYTVEAQNCSRPPMLEEDDFCGAATFVSPRSYASTSGILPPSRSNVNIASTEVQAREIDDIHEEVSGVLGALSITSHTKEPMATRKGVNNMQGEVILWPQICLATKHTEHTEHTGTPSSQPTKGPRFPRLSSPLAMQGPSPVSVEVSLVNAYGELTAGSSALSSILPQKPTTKIKTKTDNVDVSLGGVV